MASHCCFYQTKLVLNAGYFVLLDLRVYIPQEWGIPAKPGKMNLTDTLPKSENQDTINKQ